MATKKTKKKVARKRTSNAPPNEVYTLSNLEQVKTLADPLRVRILETLCEERTTKQVADLLDEKPTRLYRHVDALEKAGLIRLIRTRQNRGTLEKYYQAVARAFRTDPRLFDLSPEGEEAKTLQKMLSTVFVNTQLEMQKLMTLGKGALELEENGILSYMEIRGTKKEMQRIQSVLEKLVKQACDSVEIPEEKKGIRRYRLTIAYFPLDLETEEGGDG